MSALGQKRTSGHVRVMSALPPKADIAERECHVRFVPEPDIEESAFSGYPRGRPPASRRAYCMALLTTGPTKASKRLRSAGSRLPSPRKSA